MQGQVADKPGDVAGEEVLPGNIQSPVSNTEAPTRPESGLSRTKVIARQRNALLCLSIERVEGCVRVDKLARLPGSQDRIKGILLFRGRPVPLVSLVEGLSDGASRKHWHEDFALVLSARGIEFALRVDGVPELIEGPVPCRSDTAKVSVIRTRHIERFLEMCDFPCSEAAHCPRVPACHRAG